MISDRAVRLALVLALLLFSVVSLWAQSSTGTVKGVIVDKDGNPLPGVTVSLENPSMAVTGLGGITNAQGEFRITPVPPGKGYILRASIPSYQKIEVVLDVPAGRTVVQNMTLRPALVERFKVVGKEDVVKTESTTTSTTITSEFISGLPVLGRDYQDVLTLAPGVTDVNNTGNPNIHGARDTDVVTLVDGVSTTDPFTGQFGQQLNVESIDQIEVITSGATAEYSRAQGGFVNIITKSGGNEFKGTFKFFMRSNKIDGDGAGIDSSELRGGIGETDGFRNLSFTDLYPFMSLSGAFVKDRLWYYFAPEYSQVEDPIDAGTQAYVATTISTRVTGKTTWQVSPSNKLAFLVLYDDTSQDNLGLNSLTALESGQKATRGGPTLTLTDTAIISPTLSLESTVSRFDQSFSFRPAIDPDTNGNGILTVDDRPDMGGNRNGFIELREYGDPGLDLDSDGKWDVFEDFDRDRTLDGCVTGTPNMPIEGKCDGTGDECTTSADCPGEGQHCVGEIGTSCWARPANHFTGEDRDRDGRLTLPNGCEGDQREDINCNGFLDFETDLNQNGEVDGFEDTGIPCTNPSVCPQGYEPGTRNNGAFDTEDRDGNGVLSTLPGSLDTPFPFLNDRNNNGQIDFGEFVSPPRGDRNYVLDFNTNRITGPFFFEFGDSRTRDSIKEDLSYYIDDLLGSHDIKLGGSFEKEGFSRDTHIRPFLQIDHSGLNEATGQIGGLIDAVVLPTTDRVHNTAGSDNFGFYIQDTYKPLANLTLGLGLRFDREEINSHGFSFFDPAAQRREYDILINLKGIESGFGSDLNADGILTRGLDFDPLYQSASNPRVASLNSELGLLAPTKFTRHNFESDVESVLLSEFGIDDPALLGLGQIRSPEDFTITNNNLAPRLSVAWDPWADGKSKGFFSWGRFYDKLFLNSVIGEEGPDSLNPYYRFDSDGIDAQGRPDNNVGAPISKAPPSASQVDRGMRTPYTQELTLGFEREIAPELSVSLTYIRRKFRDQLQDIDANHTTRKPPFCSADDVTPSGYCDVFGRTLVSPPSDGRGGDPNNLGPDQRAGDSRPDLYINNFNFNQIFRVGNYNTQDYDAFELQLTRRLSRKWQMDASYVFSKATGTAESFNGESGDDPALTELRDGYLSYDQRHVAKFHAIAYLPGDWQLGGGLTWASGLPFSNVIRFRSSDNVDFAQTRRLYGYQDLNSGKFITEPRNNHRNHATYDLNARTQKNFVIGQVSAGAFFEIFNLLNTDDLRVNEIDTRIRLLQADETRRFGRRFQFGIQLDF